jgi:hypothetical protein
MTGHQIWARNRHETIPAISRAKYALKDIMLSGTYSPLLFGLEFIGMIRRFLFFALFTQQPVGRNLDIPNAAELQLALQINRDDFMIED